MSSAYLDASVLIPRIVIEPATPGVDRFINGWAGVLAMSEFTAVEVASGIARLLRMGLLQRADAESRLQDFDAWRAATSVHVDLHEPDMRRAGALVRRFDLKLRAPDALHLATCERLGMTLVTLDRRLAAAADALGVPRVVPATPHSAGVT